MTREDASTLLDKYNERVASEEEAALVQYWYISRATESGIDQSEQDYLRMANEMKMNVTAATQLQKPFALWPKVAMVAAALAAVLFGMWFFVAPGKLISSLPEFVAGSKDLPPGRVGATLTLANGQQLKLDGEANAEVAREAGIMITKTAKGELVYVVSGQAKSTGSLNTLSTAKGETYRLILPDGSIVWLNAASSITYNAGLLNAGYRRVRLEGEAFFEIAKDKAHPFLVESNSQLIKVLGTHFNVNAYLDMPSIETTLTEGKIEVSIGKATKILSPGQQALAVKDQIRVGTADMSAVLAWKNNEFVFEKESIENVMLELARWYNIEVIYSGEVPAERITGGISRQNNLSKVLQIIQSAGIAHFKIENNRVYVSR